MERASDSPLPRNIVLCFDGTGDWIGSGQTNVAKIFAALDRDTQLTFYDGGIGTLNDDRSWTSVVRDLRRLVDLGVATNLQEKGLNGYLFIVDHYQPGDRIFMFGFSRGAYTARLVASLLRDFGILRPDARHLAPYLWQTSTKRLPKKDQSFESRETLVDYELAFYDFREQFSIPLEDTAKVSFMGLFDTVSSVGVLSRFDVHRHIDENVWIERVCHAIAMDEERNAFPELPFSAEQRGLTEVWFPGVHRDVGGGTIDFPAIADAALGWIADEAVKEGLRLTETFPLYDSSGRGEVRGNFPGFDPYVALGLYPMRIFTKRFGAFRTYWPNFRHTRPIPANALVHQIAQAMPPERGTGRPPAHWPAQPRWYPEEGALRSDTPAPAANERVALADLGGMVLAMPAILLLYYSAIGSPAGNAWPVGSKPFFAIALVIVLVLQGMGRRLYEVIPSALRPRNTPVVLTTSLVIAVFVAVSFPVWFWPWIYTASAYGVLLWAWAQLSPPRFLAPRLVRPSLRMNQALGILIGNLLLMTGAALVIAAAVFLFRFAFLDPPFMTRKIWGYTVLVTTSGAFWATFVEIAHDRRILAKKG